jgi:RNA-binding protein YhbY
MTPAVLSSIMDVLVKRSFVRLRCGVGGKGRQALAKQLEELLDCAVVHQIGFTVTLYRQQGLARPQGCSCSLKS